MRSDNRTKLTLKGSLLLLGVIWLFAISSACEIDTKIATDGKNPPALKLSGSGNLERLVVMEVPADNQTQTTQRESDRNILLWEIRPPSSDDAIKRLPEITYGKVPPGFVQKFPADGSAPPRLVPGKIYEVGCIAYNANGTQIWIRIENGRTVQVPIPGSVPPTVRGGSPSNMQVR
jgi:hypothetical protein